MKHECDFSDMAGANPVCRDLAPEPEPLHTLMSMVTDWIWRANRPWREPTAVEQAARVTFTPEYITRHVTATIDVCRALRGRNPLVDMLDKMERGTYTPPVTDGKAYALKNVPPCPECGKYSFHRIDCEQAKKMDVRFRNYIPKSWEPDAVPESRPPGYAHDAITGTGDGWCVDCRHHRANHIDQGWQNLEKNRKVGCVLAGCSCKRNPNTIASEVKIDPDTKQPICEAEFMVMKPGQRIGLLDEHGKLHVLITMSKTSKPFTLITTYPWGSEPTHVA